MKSIALIMVSALAGYVFGLHMGKAAAAEIGDHLCEQIEEAIKKYEKNTVSNVTVSVEANVR